MSPAAARMERPADNVQAHQIDVLLKERVVPEKVFARVMELHFRGMSMAKAQEVIDYLDGCTFKPEFKDRPYV